MSNPAGTMNRFDVLGIDVYAIDPTGAIQTIGGWIEARTPHYVCVTGVHGIMECQRDPELRDIHNRAGLVVPDGMPLVWLGRRAGFQAMQRVYGPDLLLRCCHESRARGWTHFFYGGGPGVADELARRLAERFPGLSIAGTWCPPFRPLTEQEDAEVRQRIDDSGADIVWVGLSTPKQERWMATHVGNVKAPVLIGIGAAFDFHSGGKSQAPVWMQQNGLEWLYRMIQEPRRLGPRYLRNNPAFIRRIIADSALRRRKRTTSP